MWLLPPCQELSDNSWELLLSQSCLGLLSQYLLGSVWEHVVRKSSPSGVTMTLEWRNTTRTKVLAKMQSGRLDVGAGERKADSKLWPHKDRGLGICNIMKTRCFCTMPQNLQPSQVADRLLQDPWPEPCWREGFLPEGKSESGFPASS